MSIHKSLNTILTAGLTCLLALASPNGRAEIQPRLGDVLTMPQTLASFTAPASTNSSPPRTHAMALIGDSPLPSVPRETAQRFLQADAGGSVTCGILQGTRRILCWGRNDFGQASPPVGRYSHIAMGDNHGCALTTTGALRCWGLSSAFPKPEQAKGRFLNIAAGDDHTCALRANRTLACWGNNDNGELNVPAGKFSQVVARGDHSCAVTTDKRLLCWGEKSFTDYAQSMRVSVKKVATGQLHACALGIDGLAKCWGNGIHGENQAPADRFIDIVAGDWHTCGLRADHTALCWGRDQYGQTQVGMDKYRMIAGGGMQTCGILRGSRHLACHGSFANNEVWFPQDRQAQSLAYQNDGLARPQLAFLTIFQGVSGLLSSGIVNTGKMVDQKMEKWEGRMVPVQLAALITNMFLGFASKPEDSTVKIFDTLKDIQADIRKIEKGIDELKAQLHRTELAVLQSWCDQQLVDYSSAYNLMDGDAYGSTTGARNAYLQLLKAQEAVLTQSIDQQKVAAYPTAELEKFRDRYLAQIKSARTKLANSLIGGNGMQTAAFSACFQKGYAEWKTAVTANAGKAYPFDDRPIYDHVYQVLRGALLMQGEMISMEQDMEMQMAHQKLVEPRVDNAPPIDFNPQEHALGFCLYADERKVSSHPEYSPRWMDVAAICQQNRDRIQNAYADMVKQVEFVGGAYSDEQVVLSMTAEQMGFPKSNNDRNWLWMRNVPDQSSELNNTNGHGSVTGKWMDFHHRSDSSPFVWMPPFDMGSDAGIYYRNRGCWNSACKDESFEQGVWHSNGQSWEDLYSFRKDRRAGAGVDGTSDDLVGSMIQLEDMTSAACERDAAGNCKMREISPGKFEPIPGPRLSLFTGLNNKPFWMNAKSFTYNARSRLNIPQDYVKSETGEYFRIKCFVAEGVNRDITGYPTDIGYYQPESSFGSSRWEDWVWGSNQHQLMFTGRVCSSDELGASLSMQYESAKVTVTQVKDCSGTDYFGDGATTGAKRFATFCSGLGYDGSSTRYGFALGWMVAKARLITVPFGSDYFVVDEYLDNFKPSADGNLYHMPVVDISQRKCKYQMVGNSKRQPERIAGGVNVPSICGEDMDKLISDIIPRPEFPPVPEHVVRMPELKELN